MTLSASHPRTGQAAAAYLFHALSDETRLAVLEMLRSGEQCVCDLQSALDVAQSRLSFHLKVLKDAGLVTDRKDGRWSYYSLRAARLADGSALLDRLASKTAGGRALELHQLERHAGGATAVANKGVTPARKRSARKGSSACCE